MSVIDFTLLVPTETDYPTEDEIAEEVLPDEAEVPRYTQDEIAEALSTHRLTVEHCLYLHEQHINWQVQHEPRKGRTNE